MARPSIWQDKFRSDNDFVVLRPVKVHGIVLTPGDPFDKTTVTTRTLRQLFDSRKIKVSQVANDQALIVKHIGRGKFGVFKDGERITIEPMTREEAEAYAQR
jgi:hypothetical protein